MAVYSKTLVDIPEGDGVHVKTAGAKSEKYVYKHIKYFRNKDGKPRNQSKAIGKYDAVSGKMFPNANYFELFKIDEELPDIDVWEYGYSYIILKICEDMGLLDCLNNAFGANRMLDILVMASYIIRNGSAMDAIDDWQQRNYFPGYDKLLNSQATSRIFKSLSAGQMNTFFIEWVKKALTDGAVCYDVTSISSYARQMTSVERGYNRDGEDLAQFNIGMFCDENNKTPIYYNRYNGSLTDKTNLPYVLANAKDVGIKRVKIVSDGGFLEKKCLSSLYDLCKSFIVGLPNHLKESKEIIEMYGDKVNNYAYQLDVPHTFCLPVPCEVQGIKGKVLLYFDALNHAMLCNELNEKINRYKAELAKLKHYPKSKLSRYEPYFIITKHNGGAGFDYAVDIEKVERLRKRKGMFLIFTTDMDETPENALYHYRAKDVVEKLFDQIKCDMDGNRIRTHSEETTDGKTFVIFIACVIRTYLLNKLSQYLTDSSTSLKKALNQLSNIRVVSSHTGLRFTKALSKKQKDILKSFSADKAILGSLP